MDLYNRFCNLVNFQSNEETFMISTKVKDWIVKLMLTVSESCNKILSEIITKVCSPSSIHKSSNEASLGAANKSLLQEEISTDGEFPIPVGRTNKLEFLLLQGILWKHHQDRLLRILANCKTLFKTLGYNRKHETEVVWDLINVTESSSDNGAQEDTR